MGQWDVVLPFLPSAGVRSFREPERSRSTSPVSSASSEGGPNVEDIYDLPTAQLVTLEADLATKVQSKRCSARECHMHKLLRVELSERRSVEEIGLALVGGSFDFKLVCDVGTAPTTQRTSPEILPSTSVHRDSRVSRRTPSPRAQQQISLPGLPDLSRPPAPGGTPFKSAPANQKPQVNKAFKPTPVDFDFIVGRSSARQVTGRPKRKGDAPPRPSHVSGEVKPARLPRTTSQRPGETRSGRSRGASARRHMDGNSTLRGNEPLPTDSVCSAAAADPLAGTSPNDLDVSPPSTAESRFYPEGTGSVVECSAAEHTCCEPEVQSPSIAGSGCQLHTTGSTMQNSSSYELACQESEGLKLNVADLSPRKVAMVSLDDRDKESETRDDEPAVSEKRHLLEDGADQQTLELCEQRDDPDAPGIEQELQEALPDTLEPEEVDRCESREEDGGSPVPTLEEDVASLAATLDRANSECATVTSLSPAHVLREHDRGTVVISGAEALAREPSAGEDPSPAYVRSHAPCETAENVCACSPRLDRGTSKVGGIAKDRDGGRRTSRPRERRFELDLVGLDPRILESGGIRSYVTIFPSLSAIFTWGLSSGENAEKRERNLRDAAQLFTQFCDIIGSLGAQFERLSPLENATPNVTQQALSAMGTRSAGLYGVFLKGIIDKLPVPGALPASSCPNVVGLRYYKVVQNRTDVYDIVTRVFHKKDGWEELPHGFGLSNVWNLCWTWSKPKLDYSRLCVWQKVNHFPENKHLARKDCLKRLVERYTRIGGKAAQYFTVCPKTFVLPKEYCQFIEYFASIAEHEEDLPDERKTPNLWIMKPAGSSRGRGIQVVQDVGAVHYGELTIIQQYIPHPLLINGFKWDMRTYVTVTSFNPLEAFIYREGFARFTTVPFSTRPEDLENKFVHLTNSSIQRHNCNEGGLDPFDPVSRQDALIGGTKISFKVLKDRLEGLGVRWDVVWTRMIDVVLKSLCMAEDQIPNQVNSFELFGYDLLLDADLRIWLIEVNSSPSMGQEHLLDEQVKQTLINDTIDLVEPVEFDRRKLAHVLHRHLDKKNTGRQQLDIDLHAILGGRNPRQHGEMPEKMGDYERIAPGEQCDGILRARSSIFR